MISTPLSIRLIFPVETERTCARVQKGALPRGSPASQPWPNREFKLLTASLLWRLIVGISNTD